MTKQQESEILTRVGPGTPTGNVLRHYWFPALKSSELVPDGAPVRFLLLGEQLIAFRDTQGRIGIMDHRCPHRCSLVAMRRTASVASIMVGSTTISATASRRWRATS